MSLSKILERGVPDANYPSAQPSLPDGAIGAADVKETAAPTKLSKAAMKSKASKATTKTKRGIVYLSRVPPGLDVGIVRSILGRVGPLDRVWLRAEGKEFVAARRSLGGRRRAGYTDGWVEFLRTADADSAVELLNGQPMTGATRRGRFQNDLWCLRLLPGFNWDDLVNEACGPKRERVLRVKSEVAAARRERAFVEQRAALAKSIENSEERQKTSALAPLLDDEMEANEAEKEEERRVPVEKRLVRRYRQKRALDDETYGDDERRALRRLEREEAGDGSAINDDLIAKLFKSR
jgi:hypothetical protein